MLTNNSSKVIQVKVYDLFALGMTIVIGGQYFAWNAGLKAGFGPFAIASFLMGFGYICLCLSIGEVTSAAPFAGGSYGMARCTLGNHLGFFVGCAECAEYILYVATSVLVLSEMIVLVVPSFDGYEPIIWLIFFATALPIHIYGGRIFWNATIVLAVASVVLLLIFAFGSMSFVDFNKFSTSADLNMFEGGMKEFMKILPLPAWFFVGVESLSFAVNNSSTPKTSIPIAQISCVFALFACMILVLFTTCSLPNGIDSVMNSVDVFGYGYSKIFCISSGMAAALSIPATYATAYGFLFPYGALLNAMAQSQLLPSIFDENYCNRQTTAGLVIGSIAAYLMCILMKYYPVVSAARIFNLCMLFGFTAYIAQCIGYIHLKLVFPHLQRQWQSPLGYWGALFGIFYFFLGMVSIIAFQDDGGFAVVVYACLFFIVSMYYFFVSKTQQLLSADERAMLYFAKEREMLSVSHNLRHLFRRHILKRLSQKYHSGKFELSSGDASIVPMDTSPISLNNLAAIPEEVEVPYCSNTRKQDDSKELVDIETTV